MATKTWKIEKDLCRCCHAEGAFDNLAEPRTFLDKVEVYSDMLRECLDIDIPPVPGELCAITYTICNACIARLRDACNFKKQVQDCEQRFMTLYYKNAIQGLKPATKVKEEIEVSIERPQSDTEADNIVLKKEDEDDDDDHFLGGDDDDGMSDDDLPIKPPKQSVSTMKTRPKPKPKPKAPPVVKKLKPPPKPKKKEEPKPAKEKKGKVIYVDFTQTVDEDGEKRFTCNVCSKPFKKRNLFVIHYKYNHLKIRSVFRSCHLCDVKVKNNFHSLHLEECHGIPRPSCGACGKKFAKKCQVLRHQKFHHMGERNFQCEVCDMRFFCAGRLNVHMVKHEPDRPFKCEFCKKAFKRKITLKTHTMIHTDTRRQVCQICQAAFVQRSSLTYHMTKTHPNAAFPTGSSN
ncbi:zinc finger protein 836-like isoform X10 [Maniola jurtina]|uniref:zinc finger protein 836-like isoform X10 n=1 Tax=Maniola jurtina TaxID=191418 RepID=UPI001E687D5F|nr:zinc finger protein 836-like isoform X10 [Maniola jurtina]